MYHRFLANVSLKKEVGFDEGVCEISRFHGGDEHKPTRSVVTVLAIRSILLVLCTPNVHTILTRMSRVPSHAVGAFSSLAGNAHPVPTSEALNESEFNGIQYVSL